MPHHTKDEGDLACAVAIADLAKRGFSVFVPAVSEHLPSALAVYQGERFYRIQCKHSADGFVWNKSHWTDRNGSHARVYQPGDFDYYTPYLPAVERVIYPSLTFGGCRINFRIPATFQPFYWYEDFLDFMDIAPKRTYKEFEGATGGSTSGLRRGGDRKVERPSREELQEMLWKHPTTHIAARFGVSDKAVEK